MSDLEQSHITDTNKVKEPSTSFYRDRTQYKGLSQQQESSQNNYTYNYQQQKNSLNNSHFELRPRIQNDLSKHQDSFMKEQNTAVFQNTYENQFKYRNYDDQSNQKNEDYKSSTMKQRGNGMEYEISDLRSKIKDLELRLSQNFESKKQNEESDIDQVHQTSIKRDYEDFPLTKSNTIQLQQVQSQLSQETYDSQNPNVKVMYQTLDQNKMKRSQSRKKRQEKTVKKEKKGTASLRRRDKILKFSDLELGGERQQTMKCNDLKKELQKTKASYLQYRSESAESQKSVKRKESQSKTRKKSKKKVRSKTPKSQFHDYQRSIESQSTKSNRNEQKKSKTLLKSQVKSVDKRKDNDLKEKSVSYQQLLQRVNKLEKKQKCKDTQIEEMSEQLQTLKNALIQTEKQSKKQKKLLKLQEQQIEELRIQNEKLKKKNQILTNALDDDDEDRIDDYRPLQMKQSKQK